MKLSIVIVLCILMECFSNSQNISQQMGKENLGKYSYLISGDTILSVGKGHMQGTGFFIKKASKIFFVCAKHTLSGCNDKMKRMKDPRI